MTERDGVTEQLQRLLAQESAPADALAKTLAMVEKAREEEQAAAASPQPALPRRRISRRRFVQLMAACLAVGVVGAGGFALAEETGQVELDGQTSVELGVNRWGSVVRVVAQDPELAARLDSLQLLGVSCSEALARITNDTQARNAIAGDQEVAIVAVCGNASQQQTLLADCALAADTFGNGSFCSAATGETQAAAQKAGMGIARYEIYLRIADLDPSVTLDDCRDLSMCELRTLLARIGGAAEEGAHPGRHQGMGAGRGGGRGAGRSEGCDQSGNAS